MKKVIYLIVCISLLAFSACSPKQESLSFEIKDKEFLLEQPTPGSNTVQVELKFDEIKAAAEAKGLDAMNISEVKLEKAEVIAKDGQNLSAFESILLQLTTAKAGLTEVALLNPVPAGATKATLQTAENAEMKKYFTGEDLIVVLDMNSAEGDTLKHTLLLNATFNISAPKK